jgi:hypothetical protein
MQHGDRVKRVLQMSWLSAQFRSVEIQARHDGSPRDFVARSTDQRSFAGCTGGMACTQLTGDNSKLAAGPRALYRFSLDTLATVSNFRVSLGNRSRVGHYGYFECKPIHIFQFLIHGVPDI